MHLHMHTNGLIAFLPVPPSYTFIYIMSHEVFAVSLVFMHAAVCLLQKAHSLLASVSVYVAITGRSFNTALGLQEDIGAQRD